MEKGIIELLKISSQYLSEHGVESPRLDAEVLLADVLNTDRIGLYVNYDRPVSKEELSRYRTYIARRAQRIPVAYITGRKEFMSVDFCVEDGVLIPRPDTEVLIDETVKFLNSRSLRAPKVLDLCTGTGAIACSLAREFSEATVVATDISEKAIAVARRNVENLGLSRNMTVIQGDLYDALTGMDDVRFDVIVSNPPYIPSCRIDALEPEVARYEPRLALDGGEDGMDLIIPILDRAHVFAPEGFVCIEIGDTEQADLTVNAMIERGMRDVRVVKDLAGLDRAVCGVVPQDNF